MATVGHLGECAMEQIVVESATVEYVQKATLSELHFIGSWKGGLCAKFDLLQQL